MRFSSFPELLYNVTTRRSAGNLAFHVGDYIQTINANHETLAKNLGFVKEALVHMKQIHSDIVHVVADKDDFSSPPTCDALVTNKKDVPLMVMVADCTPVLFFDPVHKAIGVAHAGRAGAFGNIVKNVIDTMAQEYGSEPENIAVHIGSAIGVCCYEVGEKIYEESKNEFGYAFEARDGSYYLDINKILLKQLKECGVQDDNIENEGVCTACNTDEYFSYRAEGKTGRFAAVLMLK